MPASKLAYLMDYHSQQQILIENRLFLLLFHRRGRGEDFREHTSALCYSYYNRF